MSLTFQYNKISLQEMQQQLKARADALPVLKYKEAILRSEAEKAKKSMTMLEKNIGQKMKQYDHMNRLWQEFPQDALTVTEIHTTLKNIAGVSTPQFERAVFSEKALCLFNHPLWITDGIALLKDLINLSLEKQLLEHRAGLLDAARKKTTQKVNLYEKVQVPAYLDAIAKVKKYLNDEESLGKAGQKIIKKRISSI